MLAKLLPSAEHFFKGVEYDHVCCNKHAKDAVAWFQYLSRSNQEGCKMEPKSLKGVPKGDMDGRLVAGAVFLVWGIFFFQIVSTTWVSWFPYGRPLYFEGVPKSIFLI